MIVSPFNSNADCEKFADPINATLQPFSSVNTPYLSCPNPPLVEIVAINSILLIEIKYDKQRKKCSSSLESVFDNLSISDKTRHSKSSIKCFCPFSIASLSSLLNIWFMITRILPPFAMNRAKPYARLLIPLDEKNPKPKSKEELSISASVKNSFGSSYPEE